MFCDLVAFYDNDKTTGMEKTSSGFVAGMPRTATGKLPAAALRTLIAEHAKRQP
jgi:acyl-coenzyme A synthetase/AMP-(fatty) acid ligase